ncbi:MAG: KH domain-containing protein [Verrucomicrobiota bacterium]|nr:KH domain-containing protein [Limisphaera sp.]MDW8381853.1 KH domain-containing protein [Verrucomicrobiota bacterium]
MAADPKATLERLLTLLGFEATVVQHPLPGGLLLEVQSPDAGRLIGKHGQVLSDLQYLTNRLLYSQDPHAPKVTVDVAGYRSQVREALVRKAQDAAEKVRRWGDAVELSPMNAYERWVVHQALKDDPSVETCSVEVEGSELKAIVVRPRRNLDARPSV